MNESSLKYAAYKTLLEGKMTEDQYSVISEINFLKMLGIKGGAMLKAIKAASSTLSSAYSDEKLQRVQDVASKDMQKLIKQIRQIATENNMDENAFVGVVAMILKKAFADAGITDPKTIFAAFDKAAPEAAASIGDGGEGSVAPGTPITASTIESDPTAAAELAVAAAPDKEKEIEAAASDGKIDAEALSKLFALGAAKATGVDEEVSQKIVLALIDAGRLLKEGRRMKLSKKAMSILESKSSGSSLIFERWQSLAGLKLLNEDRYADNLTKVIKSGQLKSADDLTKHLEDEIANLGDEGEGAIEDIEKNKAKIIKDAGRGGTKDRAALDSAIDAAKKKVAKPSAAEDEATAEKPETGSSSSSESGSGTASSGKDSEVGDDVMKKLKPVLDDVRKKVPAEDVSDEDVIKVIKYIDELKKVKVKGGA
jgi:hypothetical protein